MSKFTVVLESWNELPHLKLGEDLSRITGVHKQTIYTRIRQQDGIVYEGLEKGTADEVAKYLGSKGFPATSIPDTSIYPECRHKLVRNADVMETGLELEDPYGKKELLESGKIIFVHTGWVEENLEAAEGNAGYFGSITGTSRVSVEGPGWKPVKGETNTGWVLHIFSENERNEVYRIIGEKFYYDYQGKDFIPDDQSFRILLQDLVRLLPEEVLDSQIAQAIEGYPKVPSELNYPTIKDLEDRVRWRMTLRWR